MAEKPKEELNPKPPDDESKKIMEEIKKGKKKESPEKVVPPKKEPPEKLKEEAGEEGELEEILEKEISDLSDEEKEILKEREDELSEEDKEKYKDILEKKEPPKRTPKLIPLYKHKIAEKKWGKTLKEKEEEITRLTTELEEKKSAPAREKAIADFAEKHGMEVEMVKDLLKLIGPPPKISEKVQKDLDSLKEMKEDERQAKLFDSEYKEKVVPLLEKDGIPEEKRSRVKKILRTLAFTTKYVNMDLDEIYDLRKLRGDFDSVLGKGRKTAETSRGKPGGITEGPVTGEDIMGMDDEAFEKWSDEQAAKEKGLKIIRKGEEI